MTVVLDYSLTVSVAPAEFPVTLAEAKEQLNLASAITDDDDKINRLIEVATNIVINDANRSLVTETIVEKRDRFPTERYICVRRGPLAALTGIQYLDPDGATQVFTETILDTNSKPGLLVLSHDSEWPSTRNIKNAVVLTYQSGAAQASVEEEAKQAVLLKVGELYYQHCDCSKAYWPLINRIRFGEVY